MTIKPLYDPAQGVMRVAGLMSGSGSNIRELLVRQRELGDTVYRIVVLFSDSAESSATKIGYDFDIPIVTRDIRGFYRKRGKKRSDLSLRPEFDAETVAALQPYNAVVAAYGGYMSLASPILVAAFLGVNVHPADLSIEHDGKRVYTGAHAVADAMRAGERYIYSSTHMITTEVDGGPILMISQPREVLADRSHDENQNRLKEYGDWVIFPKTLEYLAQGRFARDESKVMHFDGSPIPKGLRLEKE